MSYIVAQTAEVTSGEGGIDLSWLFDVASLVVAIIVGIGSAGLTGWYQTHRDKSQQKQEALRCLINYERALGDASGSLEAQEYNMNGPVFPQDLNELRMLAYPHFRFLIHSESEEDKKIYWLLNDPASGDHLSLPEAVQAYGASHQAAQTVISRLSVNAKRRLTSGKNAMVGD